MATDEGGFFAGDLTASVTATSEAMKDLEAVAQRFGNTMTGTFSKAIVNGRQFDDVMKSLGNRLTQMALQAALKPLESAVTSSLGGLLDSGIGALTKGLSGNLLSASAHGNVLSGGAVRPFADGGVIAAPTYFPMGGGSGRGLGLMGEAGAEAIMPLARGADGKLGVRAAGGEGGTLVNVTINAADANSFRRSEAQVAASLARAVARGRRAL